MSEHLMQLLKYKPKVIIKTNVFKIKAKLFMMNYGFKITVSNQKGELKPWPAKKDTSKRKQ